VTSYVLEIANSHMHFIFQAVVSKAEHASYNK